MSPFPNEQNPQCQLALRLSLNLAFLEINDARGICKDVTGPGRWGNGDVAVGLSSLEDVPYILGLVRQAYEKQMGPPLKGSSGRKASSTSTTQGRSRNDHDSD